MNRILISALLLAMTTAASAQNGIGIDCGPGGVRCQTRETPVSACFRNTAGWSGRRYDAALDSCLARAKAYDTDLAKPCLPDGAEFGCRTGAPK